MPRLNFDRFGFNETSVPPLYYSLQYTIEAEVLGETVIGKETRFIDVAAHYPNDMAVHYIQEIGEQ